MSLGCFLPPEGGFTRRWLCHGHTNQSSVSSSFPWGIFGNFPDQFVPDGWLTPHPASCIPPQRQGLTGSGMAVFVPVLFLDGFSIPVTG